MGLKILLTDLLLRVTIGTDTLSDSGSVYLISRSRVSVLNVKVKGQCTRCKGQGSVYSMSRSRVSVLDVKVKGQCTLCKGQGSVYSRSRVSVLDIKVKGQLTHKIQGVIGFNWSV